MILPRNSSKPSLIIALLAVIVIISCNSTQDKPDVSDIRVDVRIRRFDQFLFEKLDTNDLLRSFSEMRAAFPSFTEDFVTNILGLPGVSADATDSASQLSLSELKRFISISRPLYDSISPRFNGTADVEEALSEAFRYVRYYFPRYQVPGVVAYLGPLDAPAIAITRDALAIGLQLFAGKDFSLYTSIQGQELYPMYLSRRFEPEYIPVNAMKAVAEDLYPDTSAGSPLIIQMIEKGKQWYLLDKFLPDAPDSLKTGYTLGQLQWVDENEGLIWTSFLQGNDIYTTEPSFIKNYIGEAPNTQGMPESSPGNIGQWVGWKIVEAFVERHSGISLQDVLKTDARKIFNESKYRPR